LRRPLAFVLLVTLASSVAAQERELSFADVAPIVYARCSGCHRSGQSAPFPLLAHEDVAKRAKLIAEVIATGTMPPWMPVEGGPFVGERRLTEEERATLLAWLAQGAPAGDLTRVAPPPPAPGRWELGTPDLVLTLEPAVRVPAEGRDVYRNFVIPVKLGEPRFVRAFELDPGDRRLVHHATLGLDSAGGARALDARDAEPGFPGMGMGGARMPDGHFLDWAPGKRADAGSAGLAWRVAPGDDLVLQLHLRPSGIPETLQPSAALWFTDQVPARRASAIVLAALDIDIPAEAAAHVVEREYVLPVAASVLALAPHAHYLGTDLRAWAELPDGGERALIRLAPWDFDWQDSYRLVEPLPLPAGARLRMRFVYDNSSANPANPYHPARRVLYGEQASDEMAELLVQLLVDDPVQRQTLERDFARHDEREKLAHLRNLLVASPGDARLTYSLALSHERLEEFEDAAEQLRAVLAARPRDALVRSALARVLARSGDLAAAERELTQARAMLVPDERLRIAFLDATVLLAEHLLARKDSEAARRVLEAACERFPDDDELARCARKLLGE
jgi:tetratricopeptide (TPR) repeat protein